MRFDNIKAIMLYIFTIADDHKLPNKSFLFDYQNLMLCTTSILKTENTLVLICIYHMWILIFNMLKK